MVDSCGQVCTAVPTQVAPRDCPPVRAQDCLILDCDIQGGFWYLEPLTKNTTIATSVLDVRLPNYQILLENGVNRLNITKLNYDNYGINRFLAIRYDLNSQFCYYSLFVYGMYF